MINSASALLYRRSEIVTRVTGRTETIREIYSVVQIERVKVVESMPIDLMRSVRMITDAELSTKNS